MRIPRRIHDLAICSAPAVHPVRHAYWPSIRAACSLRHRSCAASRVLDAPLRTSSAFTCIPSPVTVDRRCLSGRHFSNEHRFPRTPGGFLRNNPRRCFIAAGPRLTGQRRFTATFPAGFFFGAQTCNQPPSAPYSPDQPLDLGDGRRHFRLCAHSFDLLISAFLLTNFLIYRHYRFRDYPGTAAGFSIAPDTAAQGCAATSPRALRTKRVKAFCCWLACITVRASQSLLTGLAYLRAGGFSQRGGGRISWIRRRAANLALIARTGHPPVTLCRAASSPAFQSRSRKGRR